MSFELFISKRLFKKNGDNFSAPIIKLAVISIALGVATMLISISIALGFQHAIKEKVAGFEGHIRISNFDYNQSYELTPIATDNKLLATLSTDKRIKSISKFAIKGGILKSKNIIEGVVIKGVDSNYNKSFFNSCMLKGTFPKISDSKISNEILISSTIANKLNVNVGDNILMYFVQNPPKIRKFKISGIYNSGFSELDSKFIIGDINQIQRLNLWKNNEVSGYEIMLNEIKYIEDVNSKIYRMIGYNIKSETLMQRYPMIVDWLNLLDTNVLFIIVLMILISGVTIVSIFLILILEKTNLIGTLKALGATNLSIRKIFIYKSINLIIRGLIIGNIVGLGLLFIQYNFSIIPLNPENYYINTVPVKFNILLIIVLNLGTIAISVIMLLWPASIIAKILPAKAIKFR
ncbi:MAG: hypothetical protein AUJ98_07860 [Bacteroidetes bacterium CG2_30_33_31]|nr:MAG: hypothetical protein AUJ98_07860 [Bacteroidetes bacterium CG2_30_33_31]